MGCTRTHAWGPALLLAPTEKVPCEALAWFTLCCEHMSRHGDSLVPCEKFPVK